MACLSNVSLGFFYVLLKSFLFMKSVAMLLKLVLRYLYFFVVLLKAFFSYSFFYLISLHKSAAAFYVDLLRWTLISSVHLSEGLSLLIYTVPSSPDN